VIAYVDSSVLLRVVLGQPDSLVEWMEIRRAVTSALTEVECRRTLDRLRIHARVPDEALAERREAVFRVLEAMEVGELGGVVLFRAGQPMPTLLGTLDAIHLATALLWREQTGETPAMATHDAALATAARASGLRTLGV
jgi:predicted nucleic acid-binding protein